MAKFKQAESPKKGKVYLTPLNEKFIKKYIELDGNATEAAWQVCNCKNRMSASQTGSYMKKKLAEEIDKRMAKYGLNEELVMNRHKNIIAEGKDGDAMQGIKTYYELVEKKKGDDDKELTIHLNF